MKNYLIQEKKYNNEFVDGIVTEFRRLKYGISSCEYEKDLDLLIMRKELVDWQSLGGYEDICEPEQCSTDPCDDMNTNNSNCSKPCNITNVTNINNITNGVGFVWTQETPSTVWTITHDLNYIPNVFSEDTSGVDIIGVISVVSNNQIIITFNNPVSGKAYLS